MTPLKWQTSVQLLVLGLATSSWAQFQAQNFDEFGASQFQSQPQQQQFQPQPQPQRFASQPQQQFQAQPHRVSPKIKRPQSTRFVDPQSIAITPSPNQGIQGQARFPARQQFAPVPTVRAPVPVSQQQYDSQFVQPLPQQEVFQPAQQFQAFEPSPAPAPQVSVKTQTRSQLQPVVVASAKAARPKVTLDPDAERIAQEQAQNAKYAFQSSITDTLSDTQQVREEVRDGLALKGVYSYSDGYFKRTVNYEADENGYRVVKEDVEPIGDGPQEDPNGTAEVSSNIGGNTLKYTITAADIPGGRLRQSQQPLQQSFLQQQNYLPQQ